MSETLSTSEIPTWHRDLIDFVALIRARAGEAYRHLRGAEYDDAIADVTADVAVALSQLSQRRETHRGLIPPLIKFALRKRRAGRRVGTPTNCQDLQSPARRDSQQLISLDESCNHSGLTWQDSLPDSTQADPADIAGARIDVAEWLSQLPNRLREIAEALAAGETPGDLAHQFGVSPGRVSQFRHELRVSWAAFADDPA